MLKVKVLSVDSVPMGRYKLGLQVGGENLSTVILPSMDVSASYVEGMKKSFKARNPKELEGRLGVITPNGMLIPDVGEPNILKLDIQEGTILLGLFRSLLPIVEQQYHTPLRKVTQYLKELVDA